MVEQHYRWDFIGLSTDTKPTPQTSEKVVDGSTFYCSDTSKLYVYCTDDWYERKPLGGGGGTTYTAGDGIDITDDTISVDTDTIQEKLTAGTGIDITDNTISATGGGGDTVYSAKSTSESSAGGAVYIGNLDTTQTEQADPTVTDNHYKYFWALPFYNTSVPGNNSINILGKPYSGRSLNISIGTEARAENSGISIGANSNASNSSVAIGHKANGSQGDNFNNYNYNIAIGENTSARSYAVAIGQGAWANTDNSVSIGYSAQCWSDNCVALGKGAYPTRQGEVNIGCDNATAFNNTEYRVIGGVYDGQDIHDAATVAQGNTLATSAPTSTTEGVLGQLYTDTTSMHTYQCTAIDTTDPDNPVYTWTQRW